MSIRIECPSCSKNYRLRDSAAGQRLRCPECGETIAVPARAVANSPAFKRQDDFPILACPACEIVRLGQRRLKNGLVVDVCPRCRGTWLDSGELLELTTNKESARQDVASLAWDSTESKRSCPHCRTAMREGSFIGDEVKVDYCDGCDGLWFDVAELKRTLKFLKATEVDVRRERAAQLPMTTGRTRSFAVTCESCGSSRWVNVEDVGTVVSCVVCHQDFEVELQEEGNPGAKVASRRQPNSRRSRQKRLSKRTISLIALATVGLGVLGLLCAGLNGLQAFVFTGTTLIVIAIITLGGLFMGWLFPGRGDGSGCTSSWSSCGGSTCGGAGCGGSGCGGGGSGGCGGGGE